MYWIRGSLIYLLAGIIAVATIFITERFFETGRHNIRNFREMLDGIAVYYALIALIIPVILWYTKRKRSH